MQRYLPFTFYPTAVHGGSDFWHLYILARLCPPGYLKNHGPRRYPESYGSESDWGDSDSSTWEDPSLSINVEKGCVEYRDHSQYFDIGQYFDFDIYHPDDWLFMI